MGRISLIPSCSSESAGVGLDAPLRHFIDYGSNLIVGKKGDPILVLKNCPALIVKNFSYSQLKTLRERVLKGDLDLDIDVVGSSEKCYFVNIVVTDAEKVSNAIFEKIESFLKEARIPSTFHYGDIDKQYRYLHKNTYKKLIEKVKAFFENAGYKVHRRSGYFDRGYVSDDYYIYKTIDVYEKIEYGVIKTIERTEGFILEITSRGLFFVKETSIDFVISRRSI